MLKQDPTVTVDGLGARTVLLYNKKGKIIYDLNEKELDDGSLIAVKSNKKLVPMFDGSFTNYKQGTPEFDAIHTFAVVKKVVTMYERALARRGHKDTFKWAFPGKITIEPHAGNMRNAYYSRFSKAIKFFHFNANNKTIYTCRSFDVVAHETGHAVLDGLNPKFNEIDFRVLAEDSNDAQKWIAENTNKTGRILLTYEYDNNATYGIKFWLYGDSVKDDGKIKFIIRQLTGKEVGKMRLALINKQAMQLAMEMLGRNKIVSKYLQTAALHESFADLTCIFLMLNQMDVCDIIVTESKATLTDNNNLSIMAEEFGKAMGYRFGLRKALNKFTMNSPNINECHILSNVFTGAIYDAMVTIFSRTRNPDLFHPSETLFRVGKQMSAFLLDALFKLKNERCVFFAEVAGKMLESVREKWAKNESKRCKMWVDTLGICFQQKEIFTPAHTLQYSCTRFFGGKFVDLNEYPGVQPSGKTVHFTFGKTALGGEMGKDTMDRIYNPTLQLPNDLKQALVAKLNHDSDDGFDTSSESDDDFDPVLDRILGLY
jgi:hypothetical protein